MGSCRQVDVRLDGGQGGCPKAVGRLGEIVELGLPMGCCRVRGGEVGIGTRREIKRLCAGASTAVPKRIGPDSKSALMLLYGEGKSDAKVSGNKLK